MRKVRVMVADRAAYPQTRARRMPRALLLGCALTLAAGMPDPAGAENDQSLAWCEGQGNPTLEQQIGACTALIEAMSGEARTRALNYFRRAAAFTSSDRTTTRRSAISARVSRSIPAA